MALTGLAGRAAVITGAASGLGAATARRLASEGVRVAVVDIDATPPLGPIGRPDEVAGDVVLSEESGYLMGAVVPIDGGSDTGNRLPPLGRRPRPPEGPGGSSTPGGASHGDPVPGGARRQPAQTARPAARAA